MKVQQVTTLCIEELYVTLSRTPCGLYVEGKKQKLSEKQRKRHLSGTTVHDVHRLLRTVFDYAVEWDVVHKGPVPKDAPRKTTEERTIWDKETMIAALDSMKENQLLHLAVHLTLVGSLREGELMGLTPEDIDFNANSGEGLFSVNKAMQRVRKEALAQVDPAQILHIFEDKRDFSKSSLILKSTKTDASTRDIYLNPPLKKELQDWLIKLKQDEAQYGDRYQNSGMLFRLPNGQAIEPILMRKWFIQWQNQHPEFERIVFHALRLLPDDIWRRHQSRTGQYRPRTGGNAGQHLRTYSKRIPQTACTNVYQPILHKRRKNSFRPTFTKSRARRTRASANLPKC